jgi:3-oxoacyl-[acyl-carrier protein] reductase
MGLAEYSAKPFFITKITLCNMITLKDKTALICGGSDGIGFSIAKLFSELNAKVIIAARNEAKLKSRIKELGIEHEYLILDTSDLRSINDFSVSIESKQIDILINNTGGPQAGRVIDSDSDDFIKAFNSHLIASHKISMACIKHMSNNKFGRIINIVSTSVKQPLPNLGVSNTVRGAVANWAKTLSKEVAHNNITVNNILPGATMTNRLDSIIQNKTTSDKPRETVEHEFLNEIPMGRFATAREIAYAAAFLASDQASYITGINLPVDGGRTLSL